MELKDVFVPAHRAIAFGDISKLETAGSRDYSAAYRLPMFGPFNYSISAPALGMAEGALDEFCRHMGSRDDIVRQKRIAENATLQLRTSEASAEIDCARQLYENDVALMRKAAEDGTGLSQETVACLTRNSAYVATLCKRAVGRLVETMGAGGLSHDNLVQLAHTDVQAAAVHITSVWDLNALAYGKMLLGVEDAPPL
jgi:3-hydroxy-9,10-secoandrosta-1,3,5(10)-triene-9,17-dione monooxygenase